MLKYLKGLQSNRDHEDGFTLIELMIVVVIIGILAAIAIPIFMNQQKSAIEAGMKSDVRNTATKIATALSKNPTVTDVNTIGVTPIESDDNTTSTVSGAWDAYTVRSVNTATEGCVEYLSTTGKIADCDYTAHAPTDPGEENPSNPLAFSATCVPLVSGNQNNVQLTWDAVDGAASYYVQDVTGSSRLSATGTTYTFSTNFWHADYITTYKVAAYDSSNTEISESQEFDVRTVKATFTGIGSDREQRFCS